MRMVSKIFAELVTIDPDNRVFADENVPKAWFW